MTKVTPTTEHDASDFQKLSGAPAAAAILEEAAARAKKLSQTPHLALMRVGEDPASVSYVKSKDKKAKDLGLSSEIHVFPEDASSEDILATIQEFNQDKAVHGILLQLPLPEPLQAYESEILGAIDPKKDVDGLHLANVGKLWSGQQGLCPCTPAGVMALLKHYGVDVAGKNAVVVGRSQLVGRPLAALLLAANATVTMAHSRTNDLGAVTRQADILCVAVGQAHLITADMVKKGAVVVDVGINMHPDPNALNSKGRRKLAGDVHPEVEQVARAVTPVPGGVGLMTVAQLLVNTVNAAEQQQAAE